MSRLREWWLGHTSRGRLLFSSARRRLTSVTVRGDQIAEAMDGLCLRSKYLSSGLVNSAPCVIWIVEADLSKARQISSEIPQILDVINPGDFRAEGSLKGFDFFQNFILNTAESENYLGPAAAGRRCWVIPHHHCNVKRYVLPEDRVARPRTVGYLGQKAHLHDADAIEATVQKLGMEFRCFDDTDLKGYESMDIGIAWTRRDQQRDETRSNIKLVNFGSHGIPSVVCDYVSYRAVNDAIGAPVGLVAGTLSDFQDQLAELVKNEALRRTLAASQSKVFSDYGIKSIAGQYNAMLSQIRP